MAAACVLPSSGAGCRQAGLGGTDSTTSAGIIIALHRSMPGGGGTTHLMGEAPPTWKSTTWGPDRDMTGMTAVHTNRPCRVDVYLPTFLDLQVKSYWFPNFNTRRVVYFSC